MAFHEAGFINSEPSLAECLGLPADNIDDLENTFGVFRRQQNFLDPDLAYFDKCKNSNSMTNTSAYYLNNSVGNKFTNSSQSIPVQTNGLPISVPLEDNIHLYQSTYNEEHYPQRTSEILQMNGKRESIDYLLNSEAASTVQCKMEEKNKLNSEKFRQNDNIDKSSKRSSGKNKNPSKIKTLLNDAMIGPEKLADNEGQNDDGTKTVEKVPDAIESKPQPSSWDQSKNKKDADTNGKFLK